MPRSRFVAMGIVLAAALGVLVSGQSITVPNTFVNGTVADATQVNANFTALANNALNRNAGTMLGTLSSRDVIPTSDNTYDLGSASLAFRDLYVKRNTIINAQTYSWPGSHGASGTVLTENGSGTLTWTAPTTTDIGICRLRLSLTTATPYTVADVTAATSVFVTPLAGGQCSFHDGSSTWTTLTNAEVTVSVPATTATAYDVWCRNNAGTIACDTTAWTNLTTRATALALQNSVYVKTGDTTRRYIGSFRTTSVSGQTEDSNVKRWVWSYYNRKPRSLARIDGTATWNYTLATLRQAGANTANQVDVFVGVAEVNLWLTLIAHASNSGSTVAYVSIGQDSTTAAMSGVTGGYIPFNTAAVVYETVAQVQVAPAVGTHSYVWLEESAAVGTTTWVGTSSVSAMPVVSGFNGLFES